MGLGLQFSPGDPFIGQLVLTVVEVAGLEKAAAGAATAGPGGAGGGGWSIVPGWYVQACRLTVCPRRRCTFPLLCGLPVHTGTPLWLRPARCHAAVPRPYVVVSGESERSERKRGALAEDGASIQFEGAKFVFFVLFSNSRFRIALKGQRAPPAVPPTFPVGEVGRQLGGGVQFRVAWCSSGACSRMAGQHGICAPRCCCAGCAHLCAALA